MDIDQMVFRSILGNQEPSVHKGIGDHIVRLLDFTTLLQYQLIRFNITAIVYQSYNPSWDGPQDVRVFLSECRIGSD